MLRLSVAFDVCNWEGPSPPAVVFGPSRVVLNGAEDLLLGTALPEVLQPFRVTSYAHTNRLLFELQLTAAAMEELERRRNGGGIRLTLKLRPEIRTGTELHEGFEDLVCLANVADWIQTLGQTRYGRSMLFEVPLPADIPGLDVVSERMEAARRHLAQGHYSDVVAACRLALESLTASLDQKAEIAAAVKQHKENKQKLDLRQRELIIRQALTDFSHLAHHDSGVPLDELFDRNAAQLALGSTAALVSSELRRHAAGMREG